MSERFILTVKELHLGYIKETFGAGVVIEHDESIHRLIIDGRKFDDTRDLDILKRQAAKYPDKPWIIPFSEANLEMVRSCRPVRAEAPQKPRPGENMKIVRSDSDLMEPIDIKNTQVGKRANEAKDAARDKVKSEKLEIIRGDESVEDRIASLKNKNDINSMAERSRLKASQPAKMTVIQDDSLGASVGRSQIPLNAGQTLPSRENAEARKEDARAQADARKKQIEATRKAAGVEEPIASSAPAAVLTPIDEGLDAEQESLIGIEMASNDTDASKDDEIAALKARIAEMEASRKPVAPRKVPKMPVVQEEE